MTKRINYGLRCKNLVTNRAVSSFCKTFLGAGGLESENKRHIVTESACFVTDVFFATIAGVGRVAFLCAGWLCYHLCVFVRMSATDIGIAIRHSERIHDRSARAKRKHCDENEDQ